MLIQFLIAVTVANPAFEGPATPASPVHALAQPIRMVGGYTSAPVNDPGVQAAALFAGQRIGVRVASVNLAERQVVAGTNYRITFTARNGTRWMVVVYRNLRGGMTLTSRERAYLRMRGSSESRR